MGSNANATQIADFIELSGVVAQRLLTESKEAHTKLAGFSAEVEGTVQALVQANLVANTPDAMQKAAASLQDPAQLHRAFRNLASFYHEGAQKLTAAEKKASQATARRQAMELGHPEPAATGVSGQQVKVAGQTYEQSELADLAERGGVIPPHLAKAASEALMLRRRVGGV